MRERGMVSVHYFGAVFGSTAWLCALIRGRP
jgi:hypothetical protein